MSPHEVLEKYWGYKSFRAVQEEIISSVMSGNDALALLPTGGGKSICFQVPAICNAGICIVVSPLIALMKDQVENLVKRNIKAIAVYSGMTWKEVDVALDRCVDGDYKFLYLSPERLSSDMVRMRIARMAVNLFAIDEAHCISQWGYDFRPPYLKIADIRILHQQVPVLALTASATTQVVEDIQEKLLFKKQNVFRKSFERKNLNYVVLNEDDKNAKMIDILKKVPGTSIIYVRNRRKTQEIAEFLTRNKIPADFYHAGLGNQLRSHKQETWIQNRVRVIVATNAFGMGIDKPDVRTVIHADVPDNLEAYYQEAGRGGRDEHTAYAIVLYNQLDINNLNERVEQNFPPISKIKIIYQALFNHLQIPVDGGEGSSFNFNIGEFSQAYNLNVMEVSASLKILELEGLLIISDAVYIPSRIRFMLTALDLYDFQVRHPEFDLIIKTILRSYQNLFDNYANIHESEIAKRTSKTLDEIIATLNYLKKIEVLDYIPQNDKPQIQFLEARIPTKDLQLSEDVYRKRKERFRKRLQAMIHYVTNKHQCRSVMLLDYFNEEQLYRCGVCDYCRRRNKLELNDLEFETLSANIQNVLKQNPETISDLIKKIKHPHNDKILQTIQWMIDNDQLNYDEENKLRLKV